VVFPNPVPNAFDLAVANASAAGVFPCLMLNPPQDYHHLKGRRADIQPARWKANEATPIPSPISPRAVPAKNGQEFLVRLGRGFRMMG
jgi:hypothetical protein